MGCASGRGGWLRIRMFILFENCLLRGLRWVRYGNKLVKNSIFSVVG